MVYIVLAAARQISDRTLCLKRAESLLDTIYMTMYYLNAQTAQLQPVRQRLKPVAGGCGAAMPMAARPHAAGGLARRGGGSVQFSYYINNRQPNGTELN
jgi:hypothetical protein